MRDQPEKREVLKFWEERLPFFESERKLGVIDSEYLKKVDSMHLLYSPFLSKIREELSRRGKTLVEVGCGGGMDSRAFGKLGLDVVSVDLNPRACAVTKLGYKLAELGMDVVQADAENLPFRDGSVDLAYSFGVLHHTPNTEKAISEIRRVIRKTAFVMLYNKNVTYYAQRLLHPRMSAQSVFNKYDSTVLSKLYSKSEVRKMFSEFQKVSVTSSMFWAARNSRPLHLILLIFHFTGVERMYGSFNLIWAEK